MRIDLVRAILPMKSAIVFRFCMALARGVPPSKALELEASGVQVDNQNFLLAVGCEELGDSDGELDLPTPPLLL